MSLSLSNKNYSNLKVVVNYKSTLPVEVSTDEEGALLLDFDCDRVDEYDFSLTARIQLTPSSANSLKKALDLLEKNQDEQAVKTTCQASH